MLCYHTEYSSIFLLIPDPSCWRVPRASLCKWSKWLAPWEKYNSSCGSFFFLCKLCIVVNDIKTTPILYYLYLWTCKSISIHHVYLGGGATQLLLRVYQRMETGSRDSHHLWSFSNMIDVASSSNVWCVMKRYKLFCPDTRYWDIVICIESIHLKIKI